MLIARLVMTARAAGSGLRRDTAGVVDASDRFRQKDPV